MPDREIPTRCGSNLPFAWCLVAILFGVLFSLGATNSWATEIPGDFQRPNIVLIMGDDMGYSDIGCYGSEIETPTLDKLAAGGVRFTQFYNTSRCCPTRASLLTGLYSHQAGIGLMTSDRGYEAYRGDLNRRCQTIAEVLKSAGYRNYLSGKWHVTRHIQPRGPKHNWPRQRGFDRFYGTIIGAGSFYDPTTLCRDNRYITPENDPEYQPDSFHYTDAISDNAVRFIQQHTDSETAPFFLYVSYTSAHWPMHAPRKFIDLNRGKYDAGYEAIREARHRRAVELGVLDPRWPLSKVAVDWANAKNREWEIRCMEVYAGMVQQMDEGIGRIVKQLEASGQLNNTLILYLQDNGGCAEGMGRGSNQVKVRDLEYKPLGKDGLQSKIWPPMQTRDGRAVKTGPWVMPGPEDSYVAYGKGWANVSNTPFRGYKHDGLEGGISSPLIVHWPNRIGKRAGAIVNFPSHLIDVLPTLTESAAAKYNATQDPKIHPMEGISLWPAMDGKPLLRKKPICFEHHGNLALREGDWKIVSMFRKNKPKDWKLYNMLEDRTELADLSLQHPQKLKQLSQKWEEWAERVGVQPWPIKNRKVKKQ